MALQNLSKNFTITIKSSDKGGNIVLMDNEHYNRLCTNILSNRSWYCPVGSVVVEAFNKKLYSFVDDAFSNKTISKQTWEFVRTPYPRVAMFYALPKIHKNAIDPPLLKTFQS